MFSKTLTHGVYMLCYLSRQKPETVVPANPIAEAMNVPPEQAAKILQALARAGVVRSVRGRRGGYALARSPEEITINELIDALGPEEDQRDPFAARACPAAPGNMCSAHGGLTRLQERVRGFLGKETLAPLIESTCASEPEAVTVCPALRGSTLEMND
jgi:Rrf2 family protein